MITIDLSTFKRGTNPIRVQKPQVTVSHCAIVSETVQGFGVGSDESAARTAARKMLAVHVHALPAAVARAHRGLTVGIPDNYTRYLTQYPNEGPAQ